MSLRARLGVEPSQNLRSSEYSKVTYGCRRGRCGADIRMRAAKKGLDKIFKRPRRVEPFTTIYQLVFN